MGEIKDYMIEYWKKLEKRRQDEKAARYAKMYGRQGSFPITPMRGRSEGKSAFMEQCKRLTEFYKESLVSALGVPRYIVGIDPYEKEEGSSFTVYGDLPKGTKNNPTVINMDLESAGRSIFPTKELKEQLNKLKTKKMKTKRFYHTFEYENRKVTLCLLVEEQPLTFTAILRGQKEPFATIKVGYAVCVPEDTFSQDLAKRISLGRAESDKARLEDLGINSVKEFAFDLGILNATARIFERKIKRGDVVIKGIRPSEATTTVITSNEEEE